MKMQTLQDLYAYGLGATTAYFGVSKVDRAEYDAYSDISYGVVFDTGDAYVTFECRDGLADLAVTVAEGGRVGRGLTLGEALRAARGES